MPRVKDGKVTGALQSLPPVSWLGVVEPTPGGPPVAVVTMAGLGIPVKLLHEAGWTSMDPLGSWAHDPRNAGKGDYKIC